MPNTPPIFDLTNRTFKSRGAARIVIEHVPENTSFVWQPAVIDPDQGQTLTYSIVPRELGGAENGDQFTIDPITGALSFTNPPDFENPHRL